jgi:hypothetical protein
MGEYSHPAKDCIHQHRPLDIIWNILSEFFGCSTLLKADFAGHQKTEDRNTEKRHEQKWKRDEFSPQKGNTLCLNETQKVYL